MPEHDALHNDAHRVNAFAAGHTFTSAHLNALGYPPPGMEAWARFEVMAQSRGKEVCLALREAGSAASASMPFCPACEAAGRVAGDARTSWFPSAHESPAARDPVAHRPPAAKDVKSTSGVVLITLQRVMDGVLLELGPSDAVPSQALCTLRRADGAALVFVAAEASEASRRVSYDPRGKLLLGRWHHSKSPDPLYEYDAFRASVLGARCQASLVRSAFTTTHRARAWQRCSMMTHDAISTSPSASCCSSRAFSTASATCYGPRSSTVPTCRHSSRHGWCSKPCAWRIPSAQAHSLPQRAAPASSLSAAHHAPRVPRRMCSA